MKGYLISRGEIVQAVTARLMFVSAPDKIIIIYRTINKWESRCTYTNKEALRRRPPP